jgi:hypothetical protein
MTQLRKKKDAISNYFDDLLKGIGHRGSSFMDVDAFTHDALTKRWLVQEFKNNEEPLDKAQLWMLRDLATLPKHFTVWLVRRRDDGFLDWADCRDVRATRTVISVAEYQQKFRDWWNPKTGNPKTASNPPVPAVKGGVPKRVERELLVTEIPW